MHQRKFLQAMRLRFYCRNFFQHENLLLLDGHRLTNWLNDNLPVDSRTSMLNEAKRACLLHVSDALGASFQVTESNTAWVNVKKVIKINLLYGLSSFIRLPVLLSKYI